METYRTPEGWWLAPDSPWGGGDRPADARPRGPFPARPVPAARRTERNRGHEDLTGRHTAWGAGTAIVAASVEIFFAPGSAGDEGMPGVRIDELWAGEGTDAPPAGCPRLLGDAGDGDCWGEGTDAPPAGCPVRAYPPGGDGPDAGDHFRWTAGRGWILTARARAEDLDTGAATRGEDPGAWARAREAARGLVRDTPHLATADALVGAGLLTRGQAARAGVWLERAWAGILGEGGR